MKSKILKIAVVCGLVAFGVVSCSEHNASNNDIPELSIKVDSLKVLKTNPKVILARADILVDYATYVSVIDARYFQNNGQLKEMKKNQKSEVNAIQLKYDQELYGLNKRNLEIKTKVKNHIQEDAKSWADFKSATNNEMLELEKSIREFSERIS
jgi:hypothetical protein